MKDRANKITGGIGEDIAAEYLKEKGFEIIDRNYSIRYGELDIIAQKNDELFFVEVKTFTDWDGEGESRHRPEENVTPKKLQSLARTIKFYLAKKYKKPPDWKFWVVAIKLNERDKTAKLRVIEDILEDAYTKRYWKI